MNGWHGRIELKTADAMQRNGNTDVCCYDRREMGEVKEGGWKDRSIDLKRGVRDEQRREEIVGNYYCTDYIFYLF